MGRKRQDRPLRKKASRLIAYVFEKNGGRWVNLRLAMVEVAKACDVPHSELLGRSDLAIDLANFLKAKGHAAPNDYIVPWIRHPHRYISVARPQVIQDGNGVPIPQRRAPDRISAFYKSWEWSKARYAILQARGRKCECCNVTAAEGARIVVDHIKPLRKHWAMRLELSNLQVLCDQCNKGKSNKDQTDWNAVNQTAQRAN